MGKIIVEQIVSVDGYAEDADGGIGFFGNASGINEVDTEQLQMLSGAAAIVFGAKTYRMFADYWPGADPTTEPIATPIRELPKFVVSSSLESAPWGTNDSAEILRGDGVAAVRGLRRRFTGNLIVWGSLSLSDTLLRAGEVDVLRLRVLPVLIGRGRSFAPSDLALRRLSLATVRSYAGRPGGTRVQRVALASRRHGSAIWCAGRLEEKGHGAMRFLAKYIESGRPTSTHPRDHFPKIPIEVKP